MIFDSLDNVEDAKDLLDSTAFPYVLILLAGPEHSRIYSHLEDNTEQFKEYLTSGSLQENILEHIKETYEP